MTKEQRNKIFKAFSDNLRPIDTRPLWEWLKDNVTLPSIYKPCGTFQIDNYPYLKRPMLDLLDENIKQINLASCTQAGKSLLQQLFIPYIFLESPGPVLLIQDTEDNAKSVMEERIIPLLQSNPDIKRMLDASRFTTTKSKIKLPNMVFRNGGPADSNLVNFSARYVLADEPWQWQANNYKGVFEKAKGRQDVYEATKKSLFSSQPDYEGSDWHNECIKGLWYEYGFRCPSCRILQEYVWNSDDEDFNERHGMIFDKTVDGNYQKKSESGRIVCKHCKCQIHDTPANRKSLVMDGDYILVHSGPDTTIRTYSWNKFVNTGKSFKQIGLQYFEAVNYKRTHGSRDKLQTFFQQTLGKFWKQGQVIDQAKLFVEAYNSIEVLPNETIRFLTIDPQADYLNWLVRAWSNKVPECWLIDWNTCGGFSDIEDIINKYKIDPLCVGIDSGNDTREVYKESCLHSKPKELSNGQSIIAQWKCLRGDGGKSPVSPKKFYKHKVMEGGKIIELDRLFSELNYVDCQWAAGHMFSVLRAELFNWSNLSVKSILQKLRDKQLPFAWKLNDRANADYQHQMFSEELSPKTGRYEKVHKKNHVWDMECMQLVMALMADCYCPSAEDYNTIGKINTADELAKAA